MENPPLDERRVKESKRLQYVREVVLDKTQAELAKGIGSSQSYLSQMEIGSRGIGKRTMENLQRVYNINPDYIQGIDTEPVISNAKNDVLSRRSAMTTLMPVVKSSTSHNLAYIPARKVAAFLQEGIKVAERMPCPLIPGICFAFEIEEDVMAPDYPRGSHVICTLIDKNYFQVGRTYVFQTGSALLIREVSSQSDSQVDLVDRSGKTLMLKKENIVTLYHIELKIVRP